MSALPTGVALVRLQLPEGPHVLVSDRLTTEEQRVGRLIAAAVCRRPPYPSIVLVQEVEVAQAMEEVTTTEAQPA